MALVFLNRCCFCKNRFLKVIGCIVVCIAWTYRMAHSTMQKLSVRYSRIFASMVSSVSVKQWFPTTKRFTDLSGKTLMNSAMEKLGKGKHTVIWNIRCLHCRSQLKSPFQTKYTNIQCNDSVQIVWKSLGQCKQCFVSLYLWFTDTEWINFAEEVQAWALYLEIGRCQSCIVCQQVAKRYRLHQSCQYLTTPSSRSCSPVVDHRNYWLIV